MIKMIKKDVGVIFLALATFVTFAREVNEGGECLSNSGSK